MFNNDILFGDEGDDILTGSEGADIFVWQALEGTDIVTDFSISDGDKIRIDTPDGDEDSLIQLGISVSGENDASLSYEGSVVMILQGIAATSVTDESFASYFDVV